MTFVKKQMGELRHRADLTLVHIDMKPNAHPVMLTLAAIFWAVLLLVSAHADQDSRWPIDEQALRTLAAGAFGLDASSIRVGPQSGIARPIIHDGVVTGYVGSTWDIAHSAGYSGQPVVVLVVVDDKAVVRAAQLIAQQEPVLTLGISPAQIESFVAGFSGYDLREPLSVESNGRAGMPDAIAGATISSGVIRNAILRTGRTIASTYGLMAGPAEQNGASPGGERSWQQFAETGVLSHLRVSIEEADSALGSVSEAVPQGTFAELFVALLDDESGPSLLGEGAYSALVAQLGGGDHALFVGGNGLYSFKGTAWRTSGTFDRLEIAQGERTIQLSRDDYRPVGKVMAGGAPELREAAVFVLRSNSNFDPGAPFRLSLLATRGEGETLRSAKFDLAVDRVARATVAGEAGPLPWTATWWKRAPSIALVAAMLGLLYVALIFQNQLARRPRLYRIFRGTYLAATVLVFGVVLGGQLSVVQVLTFLHALRTEFSWDVFLLDPVIFILWAWVAVALLFWGRVYCGWLCPFGAIQELLNRTARLVGIRQLNVPFAIHERLWPIKYILFLGLFALSLSSMTTAFKAAEIEPFKTVWTLRFMREPLFIAYALAILASGLFVERIFCRYVCPLGAALAIPGRIRMFEWLKRRPQCGRECRICATKCPVQAIHPEGHINPNECVYCINCQTLYFDEHICPPLKARAARRAAYDAAAQSGGTS
ncbi:MAG: 4Fe-4S binding protein [Hyphomicrobiales bacterium]